MKFAFIGHLRTFDDLVDTFPVPRFCLPFLRLFKPLVTALFWRLQGGAGYFVRSKFKAGDTTGYIVIVWLIGEQVMNPKRARNVRQRILEAVLYSQNNLGCQVIGLGTLTSSVTDAGNWIAKRPEVHAAITHGDTYAAAAAFCGIVRLAKNGFCADPNSKLAIVGATGIIGEALSKELALLLGERMILIGRSQQKLQKLLCQLGPGPQISTDINDAKQVDFVVAVTSWPGALLKPEHLKRGAVVYDVSQPRNTEPELTVCRPDVRVIDGAYVVVPEPIKFWWMSLPKHITFGCMAETIMQAMEEDLRHHVGPIDPSYFQETLCRADRYGFGLAPFTSFNRKVTSQ